MAVIFTSILQDCVIYWNLYAYRTTLDKIRPSKKFFLTVHFTEKGFIEEYRERKRHYLEKNIRKKMFAQQHVADFSNTSKTILWSYETQFELFGHHRRCYVCHKPNTTITPRTPFPQWRMMVAASCCGDVFYRRDRKAGHDLKKRFGQKFETGTNVYIPAGQWP